MENKIANTVSEKRLSKIHKERIQLNSKKKQTTQLKNGQRTSRYFSEEDIYTHEKMLNTAHNQENANKCHNEISLHTFQSGYHQQINKQVLVRMWRKGDPHTLLGGLYIGTATIENSMKGLQKIKNRTTI